MMSDGFKQSMRKLAYGLQQTGNPHCEKEALRIHEELDGMTDAEKRLQYMPTEEQAYKALQQLINGEHSLHVPPLPEDADIVIGNVIKEWKAANQTIAEYTDYIKDYELMLDQRDCTIRSNVKQIRELQGIVADKNAEIERLNDVIRTLGISLNGTVETVAKKDAGLERLRKIANGGTLPDFAWRDDE